MKIYSITSSRAGVGMSAKAIELLAEAGALEDREGFTELGERHVDFDQLVGGKEREAALGELLQRAEPVKVAVRGPRCREVEHDRRDAR